MKYIIGTNCMQSILIQLYCEDNAVKVIENV
jgi:hypothetical protein